MIKWGDLKTHILDGVIKDPTEVRVTPDQLLVWAKWACAEISSHTAQSAAYTYETDGTAFQFPLPGHIVDSVEKVGLVAYNDGQQIDYLPPLRLAPDRVMPVKIDVGSGQEYRGYWEWPSGNLMLGFVPPTGKAITLHYFKIWDPPVDDESILAFPDWMEHPFAYLVSAYAMDPDGYQITNIRNFNRKQDSGKPEDNPPHRQYEFFLKQADRLLSRVAPQDRETFYRIDSKIGNRR